MARTGKRIKAANVDATKLNAEGHRVLAMITALEDEDKLSVWEQGFVGNMIDWFIRDGKALTPSQYDTLEKIYNKFN